jgi:REP-associated tyrosine transposase
LTALCGFEKVGDFQKAHRQWIEHALENGQAPCDERWSEAIAVGSLAFLEKLKGELGVKVLHREFEQFGGAYTLREPSERYAGALASESDTLRVENTLFWNEKVKLCRHSVVRPH